MAIWQFTFHLLPREAAEQFHGPTAIVLGALRPSGLDANEALDPPNYWAGRSSYFYANAVESLLPPRKSWSTSALMFGDEQGDGVELWDDDVRVRLDIRQFNASLAQAIVRLAIADDLKLAMTETGHLMPPSYTMLRREIVRSRSYRFVRDPIGTLELIAREDR